jgi:predicted aspartyl protease
MASTKCGFTSIAGGAPGQELLVFYGPTLFVDIGFDPNFQPSGPGVPVPGITEIRALVDTGASESCIDSLLATQLNLPIIDKKTVSGIHGGQEVSMHLAQIHVPTLGHTIYGSFAGVHLASGGQWHRAIIGRTFLQRFTMVYDGRTGDATISSD